MRIFVKREAGKIISTARRRAPDNTYEIADDQDADVLAFLNPPERDPDDIIDAASDTPGTFRQLIGAIAELHGIPRGQVVAAMKRNK